MRYIPFLSFLFFAVSLGCGGCNSDPCSLGECPTGTVCIVSIEDDTQGFCVAPAQACQPDCGANEICNAERVCEVVEPQCDKAGEACLPGFPIKDGFLCIDTDGAAGPAESSCLAFCESDGTCSSGALCFFVTAQDDTECGSDADCGDSKVCNENVCQDRVCRSSECEGFIAGQKNCADLYAGNEAFPNGAQCAEATNEANFCIPAGPKKVGDSCEDINSALVGNVFSNTCEPSALCVNNTCQKGCATDATCENGDTCVLSEGASVGFCGEKCLPFSTGDCGVGSTCLPLEGGEGLCIQGGTKEAFAECLPGGSQCADGTLCIPYENGVGRCQSLCDLSAGEANPDGTVGEFPQAQRDATCPQSELPGAFFRIHNSAELATNIDVYLGDQATPVFSNIALASVSDADPNVVGSQYTQIDPKQYLIKILPTGAPRTDPPLAEISASLGSATITDFFVIPVDQTPDKAELIFFSPPVAEPPAVGKAKLSVQHTLIDISDIDLILVPMDDDLSNSATQIEVVNDLTFKTRSPFLEIDNGTYDLLAFQKDDPRTSRTTVVASASGILLADKNLTLIVRGSANPDDLPLAAIDILEPITLPSTRGSGPRYSCVILNNDVFGFCQQECFNDSSGFGSQTCQGEGMGCNPIYLAENDQWKNLCGPTGDLLADAPCSPDQTWDACAEGLHCLEYGNAIDNFDASKRGRCRPLCVSDQPNDSVLKCGAGQACQPLVYNNDFKIGECNYGCDPDIAYTDSMCPNGLKSCKPISSQVPDISGGTTPSVQDEQAFCASAGNIPPGEACTGADCLPGNECLFPRSSGQTSFISSVASQYFGGPGLSPTCTPQCDPFDNDSSAVTCAADETCLFNFPWSAEVGHCAKITESVGPLSECQNPGEACGKDSICVLNGTTNVCFQFCQYEGPSNGALQASGCALGSLCNPFVADVGICQPS